MDGEGFLLLASTNEDSDDCLRDTVIVHQFPCPMYFGKTDQREGGSFLFDDSFGVFRD